MNMKKTVKRMSAFLAGATMVGATVMGAMAYDLSNYPSPFIKDGFFEGKIVIGEKAAPIDTIGATDIAAAMQADAVTPVSSGGTVTVAGGKTKEALLGDGLSTAGFGTLKYTSIPSLKEDSIEISIGDVDETYDTHEELTFTDGATIDTGLTATNADESFKDGVYLLLAKGSAAYTYKFDDALKTGNYISDATSDEPITIDFLGKSMEIIGATGDSMNVQVGETLYFDYGQTQTVNGEKVTLVKVGTDSAVVSVNGAQQTIKTGNSMKVGDLRVKVKEVFNDDGVQYDSATLIVGTESTKSYTSGDAFIGQDDNDPDWVWNLAALNTSNPTIGITYDQNVFDMNHDPITVGQSFAFPNDYAKVELVSLTQSDYKKYTVDVSSGETLYDSTGNSELQASAKVLVFSAEGSNKDSFTIGGFETDKIAVWQNTTEAEYFYMDHDDANKYKQVPAKTNLLAANGADRFDITYKDSTIPVGYLQAGAQFVIGSGDNTVALHVLKDNVAFLGAAKGDSTTAGDVIYDAGGPHANDISGWKYDTLTQDGLVLSSYDNSASSDEFDFAVPADNTDFKVNVAVVGGSGSVSASKTGGAYIVNPIPAGSTILDKDAMNLLGNTPLIVVGGPSVNTVAAELMGNPTREQINTLFTAGTAKIKLYASQNALLVAGYEGQDTLGAAYVLKDYAKYDLTGTEVEVVVPSLSSISVRAPQ